MLPRIGLLWHPKVLRAWLKDRGHEGDTLVVTKIDRLARSVRHMCEIVNRLQAMGSTLQHVHKRSDVS
jgi:DNA invertase Pin-like site-specific DNA recombinase